MRNERLPCGTAIEEVLHAEHRGSFELEVDKGEVLSSE
jgi:hypothetical protein